MLLGVIGTLGVVGGHLAGLDRRAELHALDLRLLHASPTEGSGDVLHVDIDDRSLEEVGWPWPREILAGVIDILKECGAQSVVLDIILPNPREVRWSKAAEKVYGADESGLISDAPPVPVFGDAILAEAIRTGPDVFLPFHIDFVKKAPTVLQTQLEDILVSDPTLTGGQLAALLHRPKDEIESVLRRALQNAINSNVTAILASKPKSDFPKVLTAAVGGADKQGQITSTEREMAENAYLRQRGIRAIQRFRIPGNRVENIPLRSGRLVPPVVTFAKACFGSGFVTFKPDVDGTVRRIPLLGEGGGVIYPQFATAVASHTLGRRHGGGYTLSGDASGVTIRCADGTQRQIPVDGDGFMLIRWMRKDVVKHIPAASVALLQREKDSLQRLDNLEHALTVKFLSMGIPEEGSKLEEQFLRLIQLTDLQDDAYRQRVAGEFQTQRILLYYPSETPDLARGAELRRTEDTIQDKVHAAARELLAELRRGDQLDAFLQVPRSEAEKTLAMLDAIPAQRRKIAENLKDLTKELRPLVAGKICLVGSTSTGAADFVSTPLGARTPGVMVHSSIFQTILTGNFLRESPTGVNLLVIIAAGLLVSLLASWRSVVQAAVFSGLLGAGYIAFNAFVVFRVWNVWLVAVAPIAAMVAAFLLVTAYRQLTEERAKRQIRDMFAHALSPALVDRLLEDPSLIELGGQKRTLTCLFSDIAGFTTLSEQLGPQGTVRLLNRYFDRMTDAVQNRQGGYLNKFFGDGIFAFFGAPVFQEDHPARAVRAAVDCQNEVRLFNEELAREMDQQVHVSVRVGISTGEAMVGNCGSTQRMDYTAIGDCVNLSSRLEEANKFFGTHILVTDESWRGVDGDDLLARPLGQIIVTGQSDPVAIWDVISRRDEASQQQQDAIVEFTRAVEDFSRQDFRAGRERFQGVQKILPDDAPTRIYLELCEECITRPAAIDEPGHETKSGKGVERIVWPWAPKVT